jgi:hypothetical protein
LLDRTSSASASFSDWACIDPISVSVCSVALDFGQSTVRVLARGFAFFQGPLNHCAAARAAGTNLRPYQ